MAGSGLRWEDPSLFRTAPGAPERIDRMVATTMEYYATVAEGEMRHNAPWTDRTTNARNGLSAVAQHVPFRRHTIILFHRVKYGIWLEVRKGGENAILMPTALKIGPKALDAIGRGWGPAVSGRGR